MQQGKQVNMNTECELREKESMKGTAHWDTSLHVRPWAFAWCPLVKMLFDRHSFPVIFSRLNSDSSSSYSLASPQR